MSASTLLAFAPPRQIDSAFSSGGGGGGGVSSISGLSGTVTLAGGVGMASVIDTQAGSITLKQATSIIDYGGAGPFNVCDGGEAIPASTTVFTSALGTASAVGGLWRVYGEMRCLDGFTNTAGAGFYIRAQDTSPSPVTTNGILQWYESGQAPTGTVVFPFSCILEIPAGADVQVEVVATGDNLTSAGPGGGTVSVRNIRLQRLTWAA